MVPIENLATKTSRCFSCNAVERLDQLLFFPKKKPTGSNNSLINVTSLRWKEDKVIWEIKI